VQPSTIAPAEGTSPSQTPEETYEERRARFGVLRDQYQLQRGQAANLTVVTFFATIVVLGFAGGTRSWGLVGIALLVFAGCVALFIRQGRLEALEKRYDTLYALNDEGLARLRRDWDALPLRRLTAPPDEQTIALDLDLLGHASLQHLLNTTATPGGQQRLQGWLFQPADRATVRERQMAAAELAPQLEFREDLAVFGRLSSMSQYAYERFLQWAEQRPWLRRNSFLIWASRISPLLLLLFLVLQFAGLLHYPVWLLFVGFNLLLSMSFGKPIDDLLDQVAERQAVFRPYAGVFALIDRQPFTAPQLLHIQKDLAEGDLDADSEMRRLGRIMDLGDLRRSMFFPVIQAVLLWNFHILWLLERWQAEAGQRVRVWLETLSELEALAALATLSYDNPTWVFPELVQLGSADGRRLVARNLGHPLLPPAVCVGNDVEIGPPGRFLLVTGSNMSGKSTLLRAIGTNIVLAQAGGPVCADALSLPPLTLATSVRIQDSLEYGVSYFMAELRRLKQVVEIATLEQAEGTRQALFLLDEILHGTNTVERQIAARSILHYLLEQGATGAVSTHDLSLATAPEIAEASDCVHFTEDFTRGPDGPAMRFDYRLRPGLATSTNALKLMELLGLPVEEQR
jgi:MutS domain V